MKDYRKDSNEPKVGIRCNFYNRGFCRQGSSCEFEHPTKLCEQYLNDGECSRRDCNGRHTYRCRYFQSQQGCYRGISCEFLHDDPVVVVSNEVEKSHAKNDSGESNEVVTEIDEVSTETSTKETTD